MADMGYFGILIPEEYGGLGLGVFRVLPRRRGARARLDERRQPDRARQRPLGLPGMTDEQRADYLPRMARGDFLGAAAISEPDVGSDVGAIACRARRDGDDWVINGNKYWCTFADGADFIILIARTSIRPIPERA